MDLTHEALKMAGALALVVLVLFGGLAWVRRTFAELPGKSGDPVMRILGGLRVGTGKHIMLVEVAGEVLVLGTTARDMTLLTTVADADRIDRLRSITNPLAGPLSTWLGQWSRQAFGKSEPGSVVTAPPLPNLQRRCSGEGREAAVRNPFCGLCGRYEFSGLLGMSLFMGLSTSAFAQATKDPAISLQVSGLDGTEPWTFGLRILFLLTALTLAPALLMLVTAFTRVVIVLGLLRQALGTMHAPPNQVMIGLAMFLTLFIMMPVWEQIRVEALNPLLEEKVTQEVALDRAKIPLRTFMLKQVREKDLTLFVEMAKVPHPQTPDDVPFHVLVPAFVTSELRTAFQIGFLIYVPFLVIDMIVASILMSMGMMMLPPIMISLPFKLVLFVLADGWFLVVGALMNSFQ